MGVIIAHLRFRATAALVAAWPLAATTAAYAGGAYAPLQRLAPGVYVQRGADEDPSTANRGAVANLGVLVGPSGVIVVNTGSSAEHGAALLAAVAQLTDRPVVLAIDTQASPDQVLGNSAFTGRAIAVVAHRDTDAFMRQHCDACVADVKARADTDALDATRVAWPTRLIDGSQTLSAGGRTIQILYFGWTEQPGSVAVLDMQSRVLFTGDMASFGVVPQAQLGRVPDWIDALGQLQALAPTTVVPGHGPPGPAAQLARTREYLQSLLDQTRAAYLRGDGLLQTVDHLELARFRGWALYEAHHRRNVHFTYLQIEEQDLKK
ncbi:MAG TPA: MBL fold metallo-hydrolase [Burkholderiaceae bacterium]|nr:MBL fold metallo-hydrolase [Burkholderiaceae bacterium]